MRMFLSILLLTGPASDGWTKLKCGEEEVRVYRDAYGIPHIFAKSLRGVFWAQGYAEAEDRLWQMEGLRRAAKGQSAELKGREALANDKDRRRRGYTEAELRKMFEARGARFREILTAYAEGVNACLKEGKLPPPFEEFGEKPRPWSETDSVAIGILMARRFGEAGEVELQIGRVYDVLVKKVGEADAQVILRDLLRDRDPSAPTTLNDHLRAKPEPSKEKGRLPASGMSDEAYAAYRAELDEIFASREFLGIPTYFGSNAWVAAPKKSKSGNALLYGGPMMGFGAPSICNEVHLVAEGLNVAGMTFPGAPGVSIGWNDRLAWTTTSGGADLVDVYTLKINPENPEEYWYNNGWKKFEILPQEIKVRGGAMEKIDVYRSVYGPLAGDRDLKRHRAYTLKMSFWMEEPRTFEAVLDFNFARDLAEFKKSVANIVTSHNFFCATVDGHIGFWYGGAHPIRKPKHDPRFPQDGSGGMEWDGLLPFERWPQAVDPPCGFFANWNNKPALEWEPGGFGKIFWGKKIFDVLEEQEKIGWDRFLEIARLTAYHAYTADYFVPIILEAAKDSEDAEVKKAVELLRKWDRMETEGAIGPTILARWTQAAARRMFGDMVDPMLLSTREAERFLLNPLLYILEGDKSIVKLQRDYAKGKDLKALVVESLKEAIKPGEEKLAWREPVIDFRGEVGKVASKRGRGTFQMAVELTPEGPRAVTLAAPGQSERSDSPHYKDQIGLFEKWQYKPFLFRREEMK